MTSRQPHGPVEQGLRTASATLASIAVGSDMRLYSLLFAGVAAIAVAGATSAAEPTTNAIEVNGLTMTYVDEGTGEPFVFVHGALADHRSWEPLRLALGDKVRFIAPTQRYFGTEEWSDNGEQFGMANHAKDIAAFITALDVGPVHLVGWSYGADIATVVGLENPELVQTLILYEPGSSSLLKEGEAGNAAREAAAKMFGPVGEAVSAGDVEKASKLLLEGAWQLPPGGFDGLAPETQSQILDNARTMPLLLAAPRVPITCDTLKGVTMPTLIIHGGASNAFFSHIAGVIDECVPESDPAVLANVTHDGPVRDPEGLAAIIDDFVAEH